jgi:hypothetical protein
MLVDEDDFMLKGDDLSGIQLLLSPDGPWRTKYLRLRSCVLREGLASKKWKVEHIPGTELCADFLTKAVSASSSWETFRIAVGLIKFDNGGGSEKMQKVVATIVDLGCLMVYPGISRVTKVAGAVGIAALTAFLACGKEMIKFVRRRENSKPTEYKTIGPTTTLETEGKDPEPIPGSYNSQEGSLGAPKLRIVRANPTLGPQPWISNDFMKPPYPSNDDVWIQVAGGWAVRIYRILRTRRIYPVHKSCPMRIGDLEPHHISVIWWSGPRGWERVVQHDEWGVGNAMPAAPVQGTGVGGLSFASLRQPGGS